MKKILISTAILFAACTPAIAEWEMVSEIDGRPGVYEGQVELEGTFIMQPQYFGEDIPHIIVDRPQLLPDPSKDTYYLPGIETEPPEGSKVRIHATKITYPLEGSPIISFSDWETIVE